MAGRLEAHAIVNHIGCQRNSAGCVSIRARRSALTSRRSELDEAVPRPYFNGRVASGPLNSIFPETVHSAYNRLASRRGRLAANHELRLITGSSNPALAQEIAEHLGMRLTDVEVSRFADGEIFVKINENVRGRDV